MKSTTAKNSSKQEVYIGVVGDAGSGKSFLINGLTGDANIVVEDKLHSGTEKIQHASLELNGSTIHLVDTPGFNDINRAEDVYDGLEEWLERTRGQGRMFSGLLYLHPMHSARQKGSPVRSLEMFKALIEGANYERIVIGMTFLNTEKPAVVAAREAELRISPEFWGNLIAAGARVIRIEAPDFLECKAVLAEFAGNAGDALQIEDEMGKQDKSAAKTEAIAAMHHAGDPQWLHLQEKLVADAREEAYRQQARLEAKFAKDRAKLEDLIYKKDLEAQECKEDALTWRGRFQEELKNTRRQKSLYESAVEDLKWEKARWEADSTAKAMEKQLEDEKKKVEQRRIQQCIEVEVRRRFEHHLVQAKAWQVFSMLGLPIQAAVVVSSNRGIPFLSPSRCDLCERIMTNRDPVCSKLQSKEAE